MRKLRNTSRNLFTTFRSVINYANPSELTEHNILNIFSRQNLFIYKHAHRLLNDIFRAKVVFNVRTPHYWEAKLTLSRKMKALRLKSPLV